MPIKYYDYTGKIPNPAPDNNIELFLQNAMLTAQLEAEHKSTQSGEEPLAENADASVASLQTIDEVAAPSIDPRLILANIATAGDSVVRPRPHRKPPDILAPESSLDAKPRIDKKV